MARGVAIAVLICATMVLIALAPSVVGESHQIIKHEGGPNASAVSWDYVPPTYMIWHGLIVNNGLRWLTIDVYDNTTSVLEEIMHQRIRFAEFGAFPTGVVETNGAVMSPTHSYIITATPSGPKGSYCTIEDPFWLTHPPVVVFSVAVDHMTVALDSVGSIDPDGMIVSYDWAFGDGASASGATAVHSYAKPGTYSITLKLTDNDGLTNATSQSVTIVDRAPTPSFMITASGLTVSVDATDSSDDYGIVSYEWDWGDGTTGTGKSATHTYSAAATYSQYPENPVVEFIPETYNLWGYVTLVDGMTPCPGASVLITNKNTSESITVVTDPDYGFYMVDLNDPGPFPSHCTWPDVINVTASFGNMIGWNEGIAMDYGNEAFLNLDVTLAPMDGTSYCIISLKVTDTIGQTDSVTKGVVVAPLPISTFIFSVSGTTVSVDATGSSASAGIVSYTWDWGDGLSPEVTSSPTASHDYGGTPSVSSSTESAGVQIIEEPAIVFGYTYGPDGVTLLKNCAVTVTDLVNGESVSTYSDSDYGYYQVALYRSMPGDTVQVTAQKDGLFGLSTGPAPPILYYVQIDVILTGGHYVTLTITDAIGQASSATQLVLV